MVSVIGIFIWQASGLWSAEDPYGMVFVLDMLGKITSTYQQEPLTQQSQQP